MVIRALRYAAASPWSVAFGLMLGTLAAMVGPLAADALTHLYDDAYPVWRKTSGVLKERRGDVVLIEMSGIKSRPCRFVRINAQTLHHDGLRNATIERTDVPELGVTRPLGRQHIGIWAVVPATPQARAVVVTVEHMCGERLVLGHFVTVAMGNT